MMITIVNPQTGQPMNVDMDALMQNAEHYERLEQLCKERYGCDLRELVCCATKFTTIDGEYTELESETEELEDENKQD